MIQTALSIVIILLHHQAVQCDSCIGCDPDIPSRQTPKTRQDWYQDTILSRICKAGQYLDYQNLCKPCLVGTFMTAAMASTGRYNFCPACLKVSAVEIEELVTECNFTRDTEIRCKEGHYRDNHCDCEVECRRCSMCGVGLQEFKNYEKRPCTQSSDTICCDKEDDLLDGSECVQRTTTTTSKTTTTTKATTPKPSEEIVEQKSTENHNSAKATDILYSSLWLGFLTLYIL